MRTASWISFAALLVTLPACSPDGTSGVPFDTVAVGTWTAEGGGSVTFAADGTGETDSVFLLERSCPTPVPINWLFTDDALWHSISMAKSSTTDCPGNLNVGFDLISVSEDEFVVGNVLVDPVQPQQVFTRR
ncbi:MAG: hypothetical protein EVA89_23560 [Sandaracinaceae bacterium]|nr:MAG: hypothetical protein EVA89_23560 [Sandaracinaceae bacterium]HBQ16372.1 hypothetical protein [Myxococcales bacterium]